MRSCATAPSTRGAVGFAERLEHERRTEALAVGHGLAPKSYCRGAELHGASDVQRPPTRIALTLENSSWALVPGKAASERKPPLQVDRPKTQARMRGCPGKRQNDFALFRNRHVYSSCDWVWSLSQVGTYRLCKMQAKEQSTNLVAGWLLSAQNAREGNNWRSWPERKIVALVGFPHPSDAD
jgi:hypothetical protein